MIPPLFTFLLTHIAWDEAALDCGVNSHDGATHTDSPTSLTCDCDFRAKREVAAKRRLVELHMDTDGGHECPGGYGVECYTLLALADIYGGTT